MNSPNAELSIGERELLGRVTEASIRRRLEATFMYAKTFQPPMGFRFDAMSAWADSEIFEWQGPEAYDDDKNVGVWTRWTPDSGVEVVFDAVSSWLPAGKIEVVGRVVNRLVQQLISDPKPCAGEEPMDNDQFSSGESKDSGEENKTDKPKRVLTPEEIAFRAPTGPGRPSYDECIRNAAEILARHLPRRVADERKDDDS
ncbi:hypothetical protein [Arthrobacter russicus]|uniref:Uncharacterized protein n=1 Tax=Arthrobacter russicus TaxID=172040 RepID=A0ABU1JDY0_9MICC|nr:hypothetical protein [Arthrobacter russicus]MDR6270653.1 hypothetical protein [Arthrobacter russicus]